MAKLYELSKDAMNLFHISKCINEKGEYIDNNTGELVDAGTMQLLEKALIKEINSKGTGLIKANNNIKADVDVVTAEIERLLKVKKSLEKQKKNFENYIMVNMIKMGKTKIESPIGNIVVGTSTATEIFSPSLVPSQYKTTQTKVIQSVSAIEVKKAIQAGELVPGARLIINHNIKFK